MVIEYLEKLQNEFFNELELCMERLTELDLQFRENKRFISLLEESEDPYFEAFSPRHVNQYQKNKLKGLYEEQKNLLSTIENEKNREIELNEKITELKSVIKEARLHDQRDIK